MYDIRKINIWKTKENRQENEAWLNAGIEELNLSTRPYNSLKRADCHTVGDLMWIISSEEDGLKRIRNLGVRSETEILTQLKWFREECAQGKNEKYRAVRGEEQEEEQDRLFARRAEVRSKKEVWEAEIESFHISHYALNKLKSCQVQKVKDLYATNPKSEPGWYAVRELLEKI